MFKNNYKTYAVVAALVGATTLGALAVSADSTTTITTANPRQNFMSGLVKAIATKFNLNESDVQTIVDSQQKINREQMQVNMQARFAEKLAADVTSGKITQTQADLIKSKHAELVSQMESLRTSLASKTPEERQAAIKAQMDALKTWATQNNIPIEYLSPGFGMKMGGGMMGRGGRGGHFGDLFGGKFGRPQNNSAQVAPTPTN